MAQKKPEPIESRRDGEGACPGTGTGCGGQWPGSKKEKPWDGSDLTVVFQEAVSFL